MIDYPFTPPLLESNEISFNPKRMPAECSHPTSMDFSPKSLSSSSPDLSSRFDSTSMKRSLPLLSPALTLNSSFIHQMNKRRRILSESIEDNDQHIIEDLLNELIETIDHSTWKQTFLRVETEEKPRKRTSHSLQAMPKTRCKSDPPLMEEIESKRILQEIIQELVEGANGLEKLSCSLNTLKESMDEFLKLSLREQNEKLEELEKDLQKKCAAQLSRAKLFWKKKIEYFMAKHSIDHSSEELQPVIQYFYLFLLELNCQKQEGEIRSILNEILHGHYRFEDDYLPSSTLSTVIEQLILNSSLANEYLGAQPIILDQVECPLPWIRNVDYENELLHNNESYFPRNPFANDNDLQEYLHHCQHLTPMIPKYFPPVYYSSYPASNDMSSYYYFPPQYLYPSSPMNYPTDRRNFYYYPSSMHHYYQSNMSNHFRENPNHVP